MQAIVTTSSVVLQFQPHWRVLPGALHGIGMQTMLGRAVVDTTQAVNLAALNVAMAGFIAAAVPALPPAGVSARGLVERSLYWAAALQRQCKVPVFGSGRTWLDACATDSADVHVAVPCVAVGASQAAMDWVAMAISSILSPDHRTAQAHEELQRSLQQVRTFLQRHAVPGVNMFRFLSAAHALDMPVRCVVPDVYCFGSGRQSRWLESSYTDRTSVIGTRIARDKTRTAQVLRQAGLPVAPHARAASPDQAIDIARQLGYPVVVKPADRDQGLGVAADLRDAAAVTAAFHAAAVHSRHILVEKHFHGQDYRLTVLHGRLIKTILRRPGGVTGDGIHHITDLIRLAMQSGQLARRTQERGHGLVALDDEALSLLGEQGLAPDYVPLIDAYICLRRRANVSAGGTPMLVTSPIHPDNQRLAERAASALFLDLAGIDLILEDISRSWLDTGAIICEVNGQPQIGSSTSPGIYQDILRELLPGPTRMPVVLVIGDPGPFVEVITREGGCRGHLIGRASADGVWQGDERLTGPQPTAFAAAQIVMANREIDAAVIAMSLAHILLVGLPFDRCDVVVLAEPVSGPVWGEFELGALWHTVLPGATRIVLVPDSRAHLLPGASAPLPTGLSVIRSANGPDAMAREVLGLVLP